ncbi:hypothetical protein BH10PSE19_BH10PSE19_17570 [soil metagenome]
MEFNRKISSEDMGSGPATLLIVLIMLSTSMLLIVVS